MDAAGEVTSPREAVVWQRVKEQEEGELIVSSLLWEVVEEVGEEIVTRDLEQRRIPFAVQVVLESALQVVHWACITHDSGESGLLTDPLWAPDDEPMPPPIDSWARGVVPVRKVFKRQEVPDTTARPPSDHSKYQRTGRRASVSSMYSGRTASLAPAGGRRMGKRSTAAATTGSNSMTGKKGRNILGASGTLRNSSGSASFKTRTPRTMKRSNTNGSKNSVESQRSAQQRAEDEARALAARIEETERSRREQREQAAKIQAEMRGKEYTYDAAGKPIPIVALSADRLPGTRIAPRVAVKESPRDTPASRRASRPAGKSDAKTRKKRKEKRHSGAGSETTDGEDVFRTAPMSQPPISTTLKPAPGVTLRHGSVTKAGPVRPLDPRHLPRNVYLDNTIPPGKSASAEPGAGPTSLGAVAETAVGERQPLDASLRGELRVVQPPKPGTLKRITSTSSSAGSGGLMAANAATDAAMDSPRLRDIGSAHGVREASGGAASAAITEAMLPGSKFQSHGAGGIAAEVATPTRAMLRKQQQRQHKAEQQDSVTMINHGPDKNADSEAGIDSTNAAPSLVARTQFGDQYLKRML